MSASWLAALLWFALLEWGATANEAITIAPGEAPAGMRTAGAYTVYGPSACDVRVVSPFDALSARQQLLVVEHEVGHCLLGLFHPACACLMQDPLLYPTFGEARSWPRPWRSYPWRWQRRTVGLVASDGGAQ